MSDENRTEQPTQKRRDDARKKGQMARSRDLAVAAASVAAAMMLGRLGSRLISGLADELAKDLHHFGDAPLRVVTTGELQGLVIAGGTTIGLLVGPIALATLFAGIGMQALQGGVNFAPEALQLNFNKLNPMTGLKQLGFSRAGLDTGKTLLTVTVIAWVSWLVIDPMLQEGLSLVWMSPAEAAGAGWTYAASLLWRVSWALAFLAMFDFGLQKYRLTQSLKMTKQEVKDEAKQNENPEVKNRIRQVQRQMARKRMMADVPKASVVITNPTHYAVALEYRRGEMSAPRVLAMGADNVALAIRAKAREHGIPIIENKPLAQALFKTAEIGQAIPGELFSAVAEVLAHLIRMKQLVM
jgi:flagellar biosynthesis protein FlhB